MLSRPDVPLTTVDKGTYAVASRCLSYLAPALTRHVVRLLAVVLVFFCCFWAFLRPHRRCRRLGNTLLLSLASVRLALRVDKHMYQCTRYMPLRRAWMNVDQ
jgi:hypothetical protein